jgi:hypothetical protein
VGFICVGIAVLGIGAFSVAPQFEAKVRFCERVALTSRADQFIKVDVIEIVFVTSSFRAPSWGL